VGTGAIEVVSESLGANQVSLWQNVLVISWTGKPTAEAARALGPVTDEILARLGVDKLSFIHLIPNNMPLPDSGTREALLALSRSYIQHTACVAVIIAGGGFWASAIQSFVTGIRVLAPRELSVRMHKSSAELLKWFPEEHARKTGVQLEPVELARQVEHAQAAALATYPENHLR
jgi:hypothetical protein